MWFKSKKSKIFFIIFGIIAVGNIILSHLFIYYCNHFTKTINCYKADAGIVFFGDFDNNYNLGSWQLARLDKSVELYNNNTIKYIICVGGNRVSHNIFGSKLSAQYLISRGIPKDKIYYDTASFDTKSNLDEAYKIISSHKFNKIAYISDCTHLFRISLFSEYPNYCLQKVNYNFNPFQTILIANQSFISIILNYCLDDSIYHQLIHIFRS